MKKKQIFLIFLIAIAVGAGIFASAYSQQALAAKDIDSIIEGQINDLEDTGLPGEVDNPYGWVIDLIRGILGTLAVIFLVLIIYAGIKWMTSGGNESTIGDAKKLMVNAVIGLIIIAFSFAITQFVFSVILKG
ncbi:MAG TPA: hypothetical protein PLR18_02985 [bacterium]|nr:hypothetical protein [bacterium]